MSNATNPYISPQEYLQYERAGSSKHEYYAGEIFAMAGGSRAHNLIVGNLVTALNNCLRETNCQVFPSDLKVKAPRTGLYTYPDVTVACGDLVFEDSVRDVLLNPLLIIDVLSDSTEKHDRGGKFQQYRCLNSLQEYLLVSQTRYHIERFTRQPDEKWLFSEHQSLDQQIELSSVPCLLSLADVYLKLSLKPSALNHD